MRAIECHELRKSYGDVCALDGVSFAVDEGRVLALLGTNGSGKTTTVRVLSTLTPPDSGHARVAGHDVVREAADVRELVGMTAQETIIDKFLSGVEYMNLVSQLRHTSRVAREREVASLLAEFELDDVAKKRVGTYSGGTRRRLDIAASFTCHPKVLFLDEPATGLDPHSTRRLWESVRARAAEGASVLLTTQYMEEADALADSVVVLSHGQVIASGTPSQLKDEIDGRTVELTLATADASGRASAILSDAGIRATHGDDPVALNFVLLNSGPPLLDALRRLDEAGIDVSDAIVRRPTLSEAFVHLTRDSDASPDRVPVEAGA